MVPSAPVVLGTRRQLVVWEKVLPYPTVRVMVVSQNVPRWSLLKTAMTETYYEARRGLMYVFFFFGNKIYKK